MKKVKILSLSFFSDVWQHSYSEFKVLDTLNKKKILVDYLTCEKDFSYCPAMENQHLSNNSETYKKNIVCNRCMKNSQFYLKKSNFNNIKLKENVSKNEEKKIKSILKKVTKKNFLKLKVLGITVGKYALFNFLISQKLSTTHFNDNQFKLYLKDIENCLMALFAVKNILKKKKYDYIQAYSTEYSINKVCTEYANLKGVKVRTVISGKQTLSKYQYFKIAEGNGHGHNWHAIAKWKSFKKVPLQKESLELFSEYLTSSLKSQIYMNYSKEAKNLDIKNFFKIHESYKNIVLVAMSSMDERVGDFYLGIRETSEKKCFSKVFKNDLEWLKYLVDFTKKFPDTFFIVRPHPRDYPSKRNKNIANSINFFTNIKDQFPKNAVLDTPDNEISIFDYIPYISLLLHSSSSLSYDFGVFGVPSLTYDKDLYRYENDLTFYPSKFSEYENTFKDILYKKKFDKKKIIVNSFRWLILQLNYEFVNIKEVFPFKLNNLFFRALYFLLVKVSKGHYMIHILYYLFNKKIKNRHIFNEIILKKYKSVFDYTLKNKNFRNDNDKNLKKEFNFCKTFMLNNLNSNLKIFYEKIS